MSRAIDADTLDEVLEKIPAADIKNIDGQAYVLVRLSQVFNVIKNAPTIEPERKKGKWIEHNPHKWGLGIVFECSECGEKIDCEPSNYCPNCGADMQRGAV